LLPLNPTYTLSEIAYTNACGARAGHLASSLKLSGRGIEPTHDTGGTRSLRVDGKRGHKPKETCGRSHVKYEGRHIAKTAECLFNPLQ